MRKKIFLGLLTILSAVLLIACHKDDNGDNKLETDLVNVSGITITNEKNKDEDNKENYYLDINEDYTLNIYLNNENMYEIESVSISGKKYTKDEFTINSAKNHIEIFDNTRRESGITVFKVEEVKVNIDEKIYKVKENFDFTLKLHVRGSRPSVIIDDHIEDFDSHQIDLYVEDRSSTIDFENDGIFVEVYEDDLLVSKIPLQLYDNIVEINDLKIDNYYTFKVKAIFNLFDEDGIKEEILHEGNFKTKAPLKINVLEKALYKDNNKISSISSNEYIFDGLTKGTDYELRIKYEYNSNGDKLIGTQVKDIKTFELVYTNLIRDGREVRHPNGTIVQIPTYKRRKDRKSTRLNS